MTRRHRLSGLALLALGFAMGAGCKEGEAPVVIVEETAAERGAALFRDPTVASSPFNTYTCATCHEASPGDTGAILSGVPLAGAVERPTYWAGNELDLLRAVNHCLYYFMLEDEPWTAETEKGRTIYAYLESLPEGPSGAAAAPFTVVVTVANPPQGDANRGNEVYADACASCHGALHTGAARLVERASILPKEWLDEHPPDMYSDLDRRLLLVEKVRHGGFLGYGGQMPPYSRESLSDQALGDLLALFGVP